MKILILNKLIKLSLLTGLVVMISFTSCDKDFGDINKSWDAKVYDPSIPALYNGIVASLAQPGNTGNIITSWIYQNSQLAAMYAATGFRMDNHTPQYWNNYYNALANSYKLNELIEASPNASNMTNIAGMVKTLMAYKTLVNTFIYGDMPYSVAGKGFTGAEFYRPKYDSQSDIVKAAFTDLKWAVDNFSNSATQVSLKDAETLFKGDITKWTKFANGIRLKYAVAIHGKDATTANQVIAEALTKALPAPNESFGLFPASIPNYENDRGHWYRGNSYVRMGSTMFNAMSSTSATDGSGIYDLRCKIFFEPNKAGQWAPFPQTPANNTPTEIGNSGGNDPYAEARLTTWVVPGNFIYSPLNFYYIADKNIPQLFVTGHEISLLKAEIYNRGIGGVAANQATAKANYEEGISESVKFWYKTANESAIWKNQKPAAAPTAEELSKMLSHAGVAYSSTAATALAQIYKQQWIALFHQPLDGWLLARRTNYATPSVALASSSPGFNIFRLTYPQSEIDGNYDNWNTVTGGTDSPTKKLWFMN